MTELEQARLTREFTAAIKNTIDAHGPITKEFAPSAAKRCVGVVKNHLENRSRVIDLLSKALVEAANEVRINEVRRNK